MTIGGRASVRSNQRHGSQRRSLGLRPRPQRSRQHRLADLPSRNRVCRGSRRFRRSRALHDEAAYAHLLEVICGLGSPIVGETEVMHQFKLFVTGLPAEHAVIRDMSERLLADARVVRARHLVGLGSRSYGSAVRRHVRDCSRVALVGTGMLAQEILPFLPDRGEHWICGAARRVPHGMRPARFTVSWIPRTSRLTGASAIVVAAPIASAVIARSGAVTRSRAPDRSPRRRRAGSAAAGARAGDAGRRVRGVEAGGAGDRSAGRRGESGDPAVRAGLCHARQAQSVRVA